ncbi:MAG: aminoacyl-tRNA hydrolase [Cyclobacteriaceae bacterium]|nr:aminoacyl-tRNA hydrolase [Cyclobacteriaceae bacterium]
MKYPPDSNRLRDELVFITSRSGGPGGQHVNKVETKVVLELDISRSSRLSPEEKEIIFNRLSRNIYRGGVLVVTAQESRSQHANRETAVAKLDALLAGAFRERKKRKPSKATHASKQKRIQSKKALGEKKKWRQRPSDS